MEIERVYLDQITIEGRFRKVDMEKVAALAKSMAELGLRTPISVRVDPLYPPPNDHTEPGAILLIAGLHRVEAARSLGWDYIDGVFFDQGDETDARLWEIAENLHRAELTVQERADHIAEWVRLTDLKSAQVAPKSKTEANPKGSGRKASGIKAAARELGIEHTEAQRAVKIAAIAPEVKVAAAEAGITSQAALLVVAKEATPEAQADKVAELRKRADDRKMVHKAGDEIVERDASDDAAEMLIDYIPGDQMPALLSYLDASGATKVAKAVRRAQKTKLAA